MVFRKIFIVLFAVLSFEGMAQTLQLEFEQPVRLSDQLDYTVQFEYFDHIEKVRKTVCLFLEDKQRASFNFNQHFPVEVEVSFTFLRSKHTFPLILRPGNTLKIHIDQTVEEKAKLIKNDDFFSDYLTIKGKDAELNQLLISYHHLLKVDQFIYNRLTRNSSGDTNELTKKFFKVTELQVDGFAKRLDELLLKDGASTDYFKDYMQDKHRLKVAYTALNFAKNNGRKFGLDSTIYYQLVDYLFDLNGANHHIEEYFFMSNQLLLYNDKVSSTYFYASNVPFEAYMNSDAFQVRPEWDSIYQQIRSTEGTMLSNALLKLQQLKGSGQIDREVRSVMLNDMYYNGVVFENYFRDSLFIDYLSTLGVSSEIKLNILLGRLAEVKTDGLRDISSFTSAASVLPYKMNEQRRNLYAKAFKNYDKKEYEDHLKFHFNARTRLTEDGFYADSIAIINSDLELYDFVLPNSSELTVLVHFGETYYYSLDVKLAMMQELKKQFGDKVNLVVQIYWGRREAKHIVNSIMEAIENENIPVKACIVKSHLSTYYFNKDNLRFPSDLWVITSDGSLPIVKPKTSGYSSFKLSERMMLDRAYFGEKKESPTETYRRKQHDKHTGIDADSNEYVLSVTEEIDALLHSELDDLEKDFKAFLDSAFADGKGWFSIENDGSLVLSKNKFRTVHSSKPVRWLIDSDQSRLRVFDVEQSKLQAEKKIQIDKVNRALIIDGSVYRILFYDEEYIVLAVPD